MLVDAVNALMLLTLHFYHTQLCSCIFNAFAFLLFASSTCVEEDNMASTRGPSTKFVISKKQASKNMPPPIFEPCSPRPHPKSFDNLDRLAMRTLAACFAAHILLLMFTPQVYNAYVAAQFLELKF